MQNYNALDLQPGLLMSLEQSQAAPTILVVDDDLAIRSMLETMLEEEGYKVVLAANGQEALEYIRRQRPALVLLDLMMPIMNGWQFLETVSTLPEFKDLPVLLLSASREIISTAHSSRVKGYLPKPFELDRLLHSVEHNLQAP